MKRYTFWYKKVVTAESLGEAVKKERKQPILLSSMETEDIKRDELTPCIGFQIYNEDDEYPEEDEGYEQETL